ncbi:MAG TPA: hypothetical protein VNL77_04090, partial [Roseiflexaceae bacterium]|nr:hypothetical protein [Roseiflexaceae bacterium]
MSSHPSPSTSPRGFHLAHAAVLVGLLLAHMTPPAPAQARPAGQAAPTITATMSDAVALDVDGDGRADPGDTLRYT